MTLDEAIKHCEDKYHELIFKSECGEDGCYECAEEHEQLAEWLKELRKLKKCRECPLVKEECKLCGFKEAENE